MFSTFPGCSQMAQMVQNNKTSFFYVLYSDKTWVFDQSECMQGPIYIIIVIKTLFNHCLLHVIRLRGLSPSVTISRKYSKAVTIRRSIDEF